MTLSAVLDTVMGVSFTFFLLSTACSALVEALGTISRKRAGYLLRGLQQLVEGPRTPAHQRWRLDLARVPRTRARRAELDLHATAINAALPPAEKIETDRVDLTHVLASPLVTAQVQARSDGLPTRFPSYLSARTVCTAILNALAPDAATLEARIAVVASSTREEHLSKALRAIARSTSGRPEAFMARFEGWYDDQMARIAGQYKRWAKRWLLVVAVILVLAFHVDALALTDTLWNAPATRAAAVAVASPAACENARPGTSRPSSGGGSPATNTQQDYLTCLRGQAQNLGTAGVPIGPPAGCWFTTPRNCVFPTGTAYTASRYVSVILGLLLSVLAASLGAPFWFDLLNRAASLRGAGEKPTSRP